MSSVWVITGLMWHHSENMRKVYMWNYVKKPRENLEVTRRIYTACLKLSLLRLIYPVLNFSLHWSLLFLISGIVNGRFGNELNGTQSNSIRGWVRLSLVIEPNRTPNYVWVRFSNQLNSIKQIKPVSLLDCVWLCKPAEFNQTESDGLGRIVRWINLLEQRLGSVVLKARKTHVILQ